MEMHKSLQAAITGFVVMIVILGLWKTGVIREWEAKTWDIRARFFAEKAKTSDEISLIFVDQDSLEWGSKVNGWPWPWPREVYAVMLSYLKDMGAKAVAMDILFTEPSGFGVEDDKRLGEAIGSVSNSVAAVFLGSTSGVLHLPENIPKPGIQVEGDEKQKDNFSYPRGVFPIPEVALHADILANVSNKPDPDGIFRSIRVFSLFDGQVYPCMGLGLDLTVDPEETIHLQKHAIRIGKKRIPTDIAGKALLRFRGPTGTHRNYSAKAVIQSALLLLEGKSPVISDPLAFQDKYVFIGFSAPGLLDLRPTPMGGVYTGAEIHATFLDNLLSDDFIQPVSSWVTAGFIGVLALGCAFFSCMFASPVYIALSGLVFLVIPVMASMLAYKSGYHLEMVAPGAASGFAVLFSLGVNYATEGKQKRFIKSAFRQYLSPDVVEQLIVNPDKLKLGGERRTLTMFFSDLEGFTSISEKLDPEKLTALLNHYLTAMTDIITEEQGTVDKYEGDAIIAFWNAPLDVSDHAAKCVRAALRCQSTLESLQKEFREIYGVFLKMRIGINTGAAVVGNFGSQTKFDYTILGDAVNLAARLEGVNKVFGTYTMISENTRVLLHDTCKTRELGRIFVVGKHEGVTVYEPMTADLYMKKKEILAVFQEGLSAFYNGEFTLAHEIFKRIQDADPPGHAYMKKCASLMENPPQNWEGVWVMTQK